MTAVATALLPRNWSSHQMEGCSSCDLFCPNILIPHTLPSYLLTRGPHPPDRSLHYCGRSFRKESYFLIGKVATDLIWRAERRQSEGPSSAKSGGSIQKYINTVIPVIYELFWPSVQSPHPSVHLLWQAFSFTYSGAGVPPMDKWTVPSRRNIHMPFCLKALVISTATPSLLSPLWVTPLISLLS